MTEEYLPLNTNKLSMDYDSIIFKYSNIKKIELNHRFDFIDIYGSWKETNYIYDVDTEKYTTTNRNYNENYFLKHRNEKRYIRIFLCFKNKDEILTLLKEKIGLDIQNSNKTETDIDNELS